MREEADIVLVLRIGESSWAKTGVQGAADVAPISGIDRDPGRAPGEIARERVRNRGHVGSALAASSSC